MATLSRSARTAGPSSPSPSITVCYVDGTTQSGSIETWPNLRPDGVDRVELLTATGTVVVSAASAYWLYRENENWIIGWASFRYDPNPLCEIIVASDGFQTERQREFAPDLYHQDIKLGWWWPGTEGPVDG